MSIQHQKLAHKKQSPKKPPKTDKTENFSDKTKVDGSENSEKKLKDISNTDKKTYR